MRIRRKTKCGVIVLTAMLPLAATTYARSHHGGPAPAHGSPAFRAPSMPSYQGRVIIAPHRAAGMYTPRGQAGPVGAPMRPPAPQAPQHSSWWHFGSKASPSQGNSSGTHYAQHAGSSAGFHPPAQYQNGARISARPMIDTSKNAGLIHQTVANGDFARSVQSLTGAESDRDGHYHWYNRGGVQFAHWYDQSHGRDWFGFYRGNNYYWTVSWHDHFWWQEPATGRWLVFWRDQWWWRAPDGQIYVYIGDQFYLWQPSATGATLVLAPPTPGAPSGSESMVVSSRPEFTYSADGTRLVQVEGEKLSAYLYDTTKTDPGGGNHFLKELGDGVTAVAFSETSGGEPLRITLSVQDATGAIHQVVLDADGNPVTGGARPTTAPPIIFGAKGAPGFDAPATDLPPTDTPYPDGN